MYRRTHFKFCNVSTIGALLLFSIIISTYLIYSGNKEVNNRKQITKGKVVGLEQLLDFDTATEIFEEANDDVETPNRELPKSVSWEGIQESRKRAIKDACKSIQKEELLNTVLSDKGTRRQLLADDIHKAIYCVIPKVASTNWSRTWMLLTNKTTDASNLSSDKLSELLKNDTLFTLLDKTILHYKLTHYTKIIVVRNPLERLLSVYLDEVRQPTKLGPMVIRFVRKTHPDAKIASITWPQFVDYIITEGVIDSKYFLPYEDLCHPCAVHYDYVIKFETFNDDAEKVLKIIGATASQKVAEPNVKDTRVDSEVFRMYSELLTAKQLYALKRKYHRDFKLFQYIS